MDQLLDGYLAKLPAILGSLVFTGVANSIRTSTDGGWEAKNGGQKLYQSWKQPNGINWFYFQLHISHKAAKSMTNFIIQWYSDLQLAIYLSRRDGTI